VAALTCGGLGTVAMGLSDDLALFLFFSAFSGAGLGLSWAFASVVTQGVVPAEKAGAASGTVLTVLVGCGGVAIAMAASVVAPSSGVADQLADALDNVLIAFGLLAVVVAPVVFVLGRGHRAAAVAAA
jgi:hypothetical protein